MSFDVVDDFKMDRFKGIEPQIKAVELENTVADQHQKAESRQ